MKKLYLIDVSSMFFRAYYAIRMLTTSSGVPTNAIYGFLSMTVKLLKEVKPDYMAFCYDRKDPSFRVEIDPQYKANRSEMPEDLAPQIPYIKKLTELLGIPAFEKKGYEADDLIGTLTRFGRENGVEVVIVSGDKDFGQLIGPNVIMHDTMKNVRYDVDGVIEKWGVHPEKFIDYLSLVGDTSDNIPGVRGIGPKGAQKLLSQFDSLDAIYEGIDQVKNKNVAKKLEEGKENAYLAKKLVTIVQDLDLGIQLDDLKFKPVQREALKDVLHELDFSSFERNLLGTETPVEEKKSKENSVAVEKEHIESHENEIAVDQLEGILKGKSQVWGLSNERGLYLGVDSQVYTIQGDPLEIGRIAATHSIQWKGFDLKNFWKGIKIEAPIACWDSQLAAYIIRAGEIGSFEKVFDTYVGEALPELPTASQYYSAHLKLEETLKKKVKEIEGEKALFELDLPLAPILYSMEQKGIIVDAKMLGEQSADLGAGIKKVEQEIFEEAGTQFNIASPKQLGQILFEKMGMPPGKKTKTGYSTNTDVLENLAEEYPICSKVLHFRELSKLKSTYVDAIPTLINPETGRVHSTFNQAHTATGRLSSLNPNLQNIPIRTERGNQIRKAFVADKGQELISADYSQIELRILAHITNDPGLCRAFEAGLDIHSATAAEIYDIPVEDVTSDLRRTAKAVNFGIAYGQGAYGLAATLGISRKEGKEIIDRYFTRFSGVQNYMSETVEQAKERGYVETLFQRRRYLDELNSKNGMVRKFGERAAINAPIQGTASDIVKKAMIDIFKNLDTQLILQVHDELIFEEDKEKVKETTPKICHLMEQTVGLKVPLTVNVACGKSWFEAHS